MKKLLNLGSFIVLLSLLLTQCKKHDAKPAKPCDVQQFVTREATHLINDTTSYPPYLFRKTYDNKGAANFIDAYFWSLAPGYHWRLKLLRYNDVLYCLNADKTSDTLFVAWYNDKGRPIKAQEKPAFFGLLSGGPGLTYGFSYDNQNRLQTLHWDRGDVPLSYDANGNIVSYAETKYTYDLTRKATQQFYFDIENLHSFFYGFKLLCYLNDFPELTSPVNIRTKSTNQFVGTRNLTNHKFDSDGKLISYDYYPSYPNASETLPITWNCNNNAQ